MILINIYLADDFDKTLFELNFDIIFIKNIYLADIFLNIDDFPNMNTSIFNFNFSFKF